MSYVYITGDKHGDYSDVVKFCEAADTTKDDVLIVLGDNGVNYFGTSRDTRLKNRLQALPLTFIMIRGNHDKKPTVGMYRTKWIKTDLYSGLFLVEDRYPNLLFTIDGEYYIINGRECLVVGGAYSVDKDYRIEKTLLGFHGYNWFCDEQLTPGEMERISKTISCGWVPEVILSHTCPFSMIPREVLLPFVDQSAVDNTMEKWMDELYVSYPFVQWYCGHWHTDKIDGRVTFMYNAIRNFV